LRGSWQDFSWHDASRGPSAIAELLVSMGVLNKCLLLTQILVNTAESVLIGKCDSKYTQCARSHCLTDVWARYWLTCQKWPADSCHLISWTVGPPHSMLGGGCHLLITLPRHCYVHHTCSLYSGLWIERPAPCVSLGCQVPLTVDCYHYSRRIGVLQYSGSCFRVSWVAKILLSEIGKATDRFQETVPRKTADKHRSYDVGSVVANHHSSGVHLSVFIRACTHTCVCAWQRHSLTSLLSTLVTIASNSLWWNFVVVPKLCGSQYYMPIVSY